ncbi:MAG TPA: translocated intimin receptor Tir [Verrucomicrobiae bacterium]|nr:translocated intimin receptor Tir [Verrucomicrobiae bacterium]
MPTDLKRIATDSHLWIPAAVLIAGIVLLLVLR